MNRAGGSAPGVKMWEGVMIRRAAPDHSIFTAVSHRRAISRTPTTKIAEGRRLNRASTDPHVLKRGIKPFQHPEIERREIFIPYA
ncbi:hypothetical protein RJ40_11140 [Methanofollis aquaemaris]|uniref:Uncharacterized protein n=1 Tax=Methanofollis aquaemaris TaxID=126734 RepID=A0A8A3S796_9EURY|nr:hypothetical protein [Methanofollis aquaemaris]QSZ68008.1 hypothetical protein RJ40_11140 [Methanofollis aquaemaris]